MTEAEENGEDATVAAQETGPVVRLLDLSGGAEDNIIEDIKGFLDAEHANAFARAYVRDSIEICRVPGASARDTLEAWFSFGENAEVLGTDDPWVSSGELNDFIDSPATEEERDWRLLDPRRYEADDEE
ncbi:hypothetical protein LWC05_01315 [Acetobacter sicerae]|uniref:Uncharacterized protein n=1 Tax=Acetobacter sicerae TaxID=85325 RepID=A0ABS8VVL5_9PROT|nr:hypothetical protein [Acetobacter sicerae]MCE0742536.1 hypothetical protein [Acetobacter sicerae]NHN91630.1 hypothetical protein [Acetobacter sicerae]